MAAKPKPCANCGHRPGQQAASTVHINIQGSINPRETARALQQTLRALQGRGGLGS